MALYVGTVVSISPSLSDDNWILEAQTAEIGLVHEIWWGGEATSSTAMATRWARGSGQAGSGTVGNVGRRSQPQQAATLAFYTTYATTQPTLDAGDQFAISWNANGGGGHINLDSGEEIILIGKATPDSNSTLCCRNSTGTATSSYGVLWRE